MINRKKLSKIKSKLLAHLKDEVYCQLKASPIHGVGVYAIRPIPRGIDPMRLVKKQREIRFSHEDLIEIHPGVIEQMKRFCFYDDHGILVSTAGLNTMSFLFYVNHSKNPNITLKNNGSAHALRDIEAGEELTIDYDKEFGEEHDFSDQQY